VWQYITLMKRIFLIDCPGVVYNKTDDSQTDAVLKGVVRVENLVCFALDILCSDLDGTSAMDNPFISKSVAAMLMPGMRIDEWVPLDPG